MENNGKTLDTKQNKYILTGLSVIFILIILIIVILGSNTTKENIQNTDEIQNSQENNANTEDNKIEPNKIINESIDLSHIDDTNVREQFVDTVLSGNDGVYNIDNKYFVILTNGIKSNYSIEYNSSIDIDGNIVIEKYISDNFEKISKIRYKIIEVANSNVRIIQSLNNGTTKTEGLCAIIIYQGDTDMQYINTVTGSSYDYDGLDMPGIYIASLKDSKIQSTKETRHCELKNCTVGKKVAGTGQTYEIYLQDNTKIQVTSSEQLEENKSYNFDVSYSKLTGAISVKTKTGV